METPEESSLLKRRNLKKKKKKKKKEEEKGLSFPNLFILFLSLCFFFLLMIVIHFLEMF